MATTISKKKAPPSAAAKKKATLAAAATARMTRRAVVPVLEPEVEAAGVQPKRGVVIRPPKYEFATIPIVGTSPLVLHRFSEKAKQTMKDKQEQGSRSRKGQVREARDFRSNFMSARHRSAKGGWDGIPASSFRNAMISACRTVGFKMTLAKLSLFCIADGYSEDGTPLVKITKCQHGEPTMDIRPARNADGGTDLRARPMWAAGWEAAPRLRWDADQFDANDVANLMARVGGQVGLGEGRHDSRMSAGIGWGEFRLAQDLPADD